MAPDMFSLGKLDRLTLYELSEDNDKLLMLE